jgi:hypothetical protein
VADLNRLEAEFHHEMRRILEREAEVGLRSMRFRQMVEEYGGLAAAQRLLKPDRDLPANTFGYLRKIAGLDLAMEFYVVMEKYTLLFSPQEIEIARWRLSYGD